MIYFLSLKVVKTLINFINYLNNLVPSIKFTHPISAHSVNFLDTTVLRPKNVNQQTEFLWSPHSTPTPY